MCYGQILSDAVRRSRRNRRCGECGREIKQGALYHAQVAITDGDFGATQTCLRCQALVREAVDLSGESCVYGSIREMLRGDSIKESFGSWRALKAQLRRTVNGARDRYLASKESRHDA